MKNQLIEKIKATYKENSVYILKHYGVVNALNNYEKEVKDEAEQKYIQSCYDEVLRVARFIDRTFLTPANAEVGGGATFSYSRSYKSHAATIISKTDDTITLQQDIATLDPSFKPEYLVEETKSFCMNEDEQKYTYERDENGTVLTLKWNDDELYYGEREKITIRKGRWEYQSF